MLDELGGTAGDVAVSLYLIGVRARAANTDGFGGQVRPRRRGGIRVKRIRVTKRWLALKTPRRWWSTVWVRLPRPVREFSLSVDQTRPGGPAKVPFEENPA